MKFLIVVFMVFLGINNNMTVTTNAKFALVMHKNKDLIWFNQASDIILIIKNILLDIISYLLAAEQAEAG